MQRRNLGKHDLEVSAIGYGAMPFTDFYDDPSRRDDKEGVATIRHAIDFGVMFIDTADMYGCGHNEEIVGQAIAGRRDEVVLATKFGVMRGEKGEFLGYNGKPDHVRQACEGSLRRLGVETIDLYYQHRVDVTVPIEETVGAMAELVQQGKVRHLGLSEAGTETIRRAVKVHPICALQTEYSLWSRDPEAEHLDVCRELGIGFVPYSPLGRGFLTGTIKSRDDLAEAQPEIARSGGADRHREGVHAGADRVGLATREGRRHRSHPRHTPEPPRR
jgi:aryl-alcohol dehydrogenase-like predicted oxidoreductase